MLVGKIDFGSFSCDSPTTDDQASQAKAYKYVGHSLQMRRTLLQRLTNSHNRIVVTVLDRPYIMISIMSKVGWEEYIVWTI